MTTIEDAKKMKVQVRAESRRSCRSLIRVLSVPVYDGEFRLQELKDELQSRGLETTGLKAELLDRLTDAIGGAEAGNEDVAAGESSLRCKAAERAQAKNGKIYWSCNAVPATETVEAPPAPAAEATVDEAPPAAEVAAEPVVEAPVEAAVIEAVQEAVAAAPEAPVVVETVTTVVETEEPAAPEVPQPTEGAVLTEAPAATEEPAGEQVCRWLRAPRRAPCMAFSSMHAAGREARNPWATRAVIFACPPSKQSAAEIAASWQ